jgi:isopentenyl diphosphate isomerase/L-lactate dehydrogenase-like FMN-dependent dehydrogenase/acetyltransferase-like isoleucine patch superfamily enzyme
VYAPLNLDDFRRIARRRLPSVVFDTLAGGAGDEWAVRRNREAFASVSFRPKSLVDVTKRSVATCLFGQEMSLPVLLAPTGSAQIIRRDAELAVARAASKADAIYVLSSLTSCPLEEVASAAGDGTLWYQLYLPHSREETEALLARVARARYKALVITVDTPTFGARERDTRNKLTIPVKASPKLIREGMSRPAWSVEFIRANHPFSLRKQVLRRLSPAGTQSTITAGQWPVTSDDIRFVRRRWDGPLIVKGIMRSDECAQYLDLGVDGFIVSNHGGRQLDNLPGAFDVLAEVVDAVAGRAIVLLDGGIRRGEDVLKAIAMGASAVLVGRPYLYALAVGGQAGVEEMIEMLRAEIDRAMALLGVCSLDALDRSFLNVAPRSTAPETGRWHLRLDICRCRHVALAYGKRLVPVVKDAQVIADTGETRSSWSRHVLLLACMRETARGPRGARGWRCPPDGDGIPRGAGKVCSAAVSERRRNWSRAVPTAVWSSICAFGGGDAMQELLASLPSWQLVRLSRRIFLQRRLRSCGSDLDVSQGVIFEFPERIDLGDRVFVNRGTVITARTDIQIGDDVLIGPYVVVNSGDHNYFDPTQPIGSQGHAAGPITIGNDVWLGAHCSILRGVKVGDGAVVAAGAVVIDDVPPRTLVAGVPAVPKKLRGAE